MNRGTFKIDYDAIHSFYRAADTELNKMEEALSAVCTLETGTWMPDFTGAAATSIKAYFTEVYPGIATAFLAIFREYRMVLSAYIESFLEQVDGNENAILWEECMQSMKTFVRDGFFNLDSIIDDVNEKIAGISDIVELEKLNTTELAEEYDEVIKKTNDAMEAVYELDRQFTENEIAHLDQSIANLRTYIQALQEQRATPSLETLQSFGVYEWGDCAKRNEYKELQQSELDIYDYCQQNEHKLEKGMDFLSSMTETESMAETREVDTTILSLVPVIGDAIEVAEIVKGVDLGTGEKLGMGARATAMVLVLFPGNIRAGWKVVKKVTKKGGKKARKLAGWVGDKVKWKWKAGARSARRVGAGGLKTIIKDGKISIDDIKANPSVFSGKSADEIAQTLTEAGYDVTIQKSARSKSGAQIIKINNPGGGKNISQVQVSPGGGRHGGNPYVKISTTDQGIIKIVNGSESLYKTDGKETATIIFSGGN